MQQKLKEFISKLALEKAFWKQTLRDLGNELTESELDEILDKISEIDRLIKKLEKGLQ